MNRPVDVVQLIERKKQGRALAPEEIRAVVDGYTAGRIPDYQMSALLMAVWFRGLGTEETVALTRAMLESGDQLTWDDLPGPTADKHSTGGVGDKVSLLLAPLAAACGLHVPMLSGRGLGHTGGTLDKLEAIPGYDIRLDNDAFHRVVAEVGCAIIGQGPRIAPADGRIYALRDVTGTVDCVPLITASIMSKKLAAGPRTIVIDLKTGDGAFMPDLERARLLAEMLVLVGNRWGRRMTVLFSDMSQPLGRAVGHALETHEAFTTLRPDGLENGPRDLVELTVALTAEMVLGAGLATTVEEAAERVRAAWRSGDAWSRMERWVAAQGGRIDPDRDDLGLAIAPRQCPVPAPADGVLARIRLRDFGRALAGIGAARRTVDDVLDLSGGVVWKKRLGEPVAEGEPLGWIHARDAEAARQVADIIAATVTVADEASSPPLVLDVVREHAGD